MVQSGIAYAAGQLLAVVAPRTVLVVDAPTDWSLAGPLWELALDDAPVDEILDVLIRRGIRTAPSFAIVRVESDAVRALVRGSVPVCFERVGEPVRLDATGATTWLEGLISGARRVLVGAVETNTKLPYLVSTGVVLVSGLALPCGPAEQDNRRSGSPSVSESTPAQPEPADASIEEESFFNPPVPVSSGAGGSGSGGGNTARFAPIAGREPRVVDLTRSESRPPAPARSLSSTSDSPRESRESRATASKWKAPELNGHPPAVLDAPVAEPEKPAELESSSLFGSSSPLEAKPSTPEPAAPSALEAPSSYRAPAAFQAPAPSAFQAPSPFAPAAPSDRTADRVSDDPGELHDLDDSAPKPPAPVSAFESSAPAISAPESRAESRAAEAPSEARVFSFPEAEPSARSAEPKLESRSELDGPTRDRSSEFGRSSAPADPLDDLLIEPADDEVPPGPAPTDLPNFEPPAVALPLPAALNGNSGNNGNNNGSNGYGSSAPQRGFGGAPAAWPPAQQPPVAAPEPPAARNEMFASSPFSRPEPAPEPPKPAAELEPAQPPLGELPLRVRGRSLRPEQSDGRMPGSPAPVPPAPPALPASAPPAPIRPAAPMRQLPPVRPTPPAAAPLSSIPPLRSLNDNQYRNAPSEQQVTPSNQDAGPGANGEAESPSSGSLLLPAFFRGSRPGRKEPDSPPPPSAPSARDNNRENSRENSKPEPAPAQSSSAGPVPWALSGSNAAAPAAWVPPVRRGLPERTGFNGGPPAMPGVLRPVTPGGGINDADNEQLERPTEHTAPPTRTPSGGIEIEQSYEPPREPPRLLGVWCDAGHVTSPESRECRVCGLPVPPQAPILVARPPLGVLIFDNGDRVEVDRPVVLGRDPKPVSSVDPETPVLHAVASATGQVSRTHAEIRADGWDVVLTDLDAMNGTALTLPGASPVAIEPGVPTVITPGARVDLGGESGFVFEVEG